MNEIDIIDDLALCISGSRWKSQHNEFEGYALRLVKKLKRQRLRKNGI